MAKSSGKKVLTRLQEIGGTKKPGNARNGIWNWRTARSVNAIRMQADGNSMEFMISEAMNRFTNPMPYIELHACSAFSFLRGGSFPEHLAEIAAGLKLPVMALLDRNGIYGAQRFSVAAREQNIRPIIGAELSMEDGGILPVLVQDRMGYKNLCELLTQAHLRSEKGSCLVRWDELPGFASGLIALFGSGSARASSGSCRTRASVLPRNGQIASNFLSTSSVATMSTSRSSAISCATKSASIKR